MNKQPGNSLNIFVTGSSGFIGSHFLAALTEKYGETAKIFCLVREIPEERLKAVEYIPGTLEEIQKHSDVLGRCDYVFHIAAKAEYGSGTGYDAVNFNPICEMISCLDKSRIKNFVFISTIGAVDRENSDRCSEPVTTRSKPCPRSGYGMSKLKAEEYIRSSGAPFTIIRPAWVYGKGMRANSHIRQLARMTAKGSGIYKLGFPGRVSLIHVSDLVLSMINSIGNAEITGKTYFAETESRSIGGILKTLASKILEKQVTQISVPSFSFFISRVHRFLPLSVSNLFINYLWASDPCYRADFGLEQPVLFENGVEDALAEDGVWVITGADSGIGFALAKRLYEKGEKLFLVDKSTVSIRANFPSAEFAQTDLSKESELNCLTEKLKKLKIKVLVNNAGTGFRGGIETLSEEQIVSTIDVNIKAPVFIVKKLLKQLKKSRATIVNIGSSSAYMPLPFMSIYSSSKAFMVKWSEALTYEIKKTNKVITFSPSGTYTQFQKNANVKVLDEGKTLATPEFVAEKIETAVKKERTTVLLGWKTRMLLMATSMLPGSKRIDVWGKLFEKLR